MNQMKLFKMTLKLGLIAVFVSSSVAMGQKQTVGDLLKKVREDSRGGNIQAKEKEGTAVPNSQFNFKKNTNTNVNLGSVKPPRSSEIIKTAPGDDQAEYEKTLDLQIKELFRLTRKFSQSANRGEIWLRLAELYVEKASLVDSRKQDDFDRKLQLFQSGKTKVRPKLDVAEAREYNKKAIQLYEWFVRDFPSDSKIPQALFFLGYNHFELGQTKKGSEYYADLTKKYPRSPFVGEAYFALGEYDFENERWTEAYESYIQLVKDKKHRLHTFSLYKAGWCLYRLGKTEEGIKYLDFLVRLSQSSGGNSDVSANRSRISNAKLESEALRDLVIFFTEMGNVQRAISYFNQFGGKDKNIYIERFAYYLADKGNRDGSRDTFKYLIKDDPRSKKAFEFQYQIVQNYFFAKNSPQFKEELYRWITDYKSDSTWAKTHSADKEFLKSTFDLREQTLRNYILQQHQTAQNSRGQFSQQSALDGYYLYFQEFAEATQAADMRFFYAELQYDMKKYDEAASNYTWVVENAPNSKFYKKASENLLLAIERGLPKDEELQKRVGDSIEPIAMDPRVEKFIKSALWYTEKFPQSEKDAEIKFRIGRLYYQTNNFGPAEKIFKEIVAKHGSKKNKYAEYSANLLLDMYSLKKDYAGLEKMGTELLANESIASSQIGGEIRGVIEKASFKRGQDLEIEKNYLESADQFQSFVLQNPTSDLISMALFNAGVNYERASKNQLAINNYNKLLQRKDKSADALKPKGKRLLAKLYQDAGMFEDSALLFRQIAAESPKDPLLSNYLFNAATMFEAIGRISDSISTYEEFIKVNKNISDNRDALFTIATLLRKSNRKQDSFVKYNDYVETTQISAQRIEALYWMSTMVRRSSDERKDYINKINYGFARIPADQKERVRGFVAKVKFSEAEDLFQQLHAINIPADPAKQSAAVNSKLELVERLNKQLGAVIKLDSAEEIISALFLTGEMNAHMNHAFLKAPTPAGLNEERKKQYTDQIKKVAEPFAVKANESYKLAVDRGFELEVYTTAFRSAYEKMTLIDPVNYYAGKELSLETRLISWMGER
jgi:cellulose synthase operon protein C